MYLHGRPFGAFTPVRSPQARPHTNPTPHRESPGILPAPTFGGLHTLKHALTLAATVAMALGFVGPWRSFAQCMQWGLRADVGSPGLQNRHCMTYNPDRKKVVLFTSDEDADLWEYDGTRWTRIFVVAPRPSPRLDSAIVYDRARQELVLVGGFGRREQTELADTWTCKITTDGTGTAIGTWTRRADFPDFARPDPMDPELQEGESGARAEHTLVYDAGEKVVRLFGGKARIVRGLQWQKPYNRENYSAGAGTWNGTAWVSRKWKNPRLYIQPDLDRPPTPGEIRIRHELGRKAIAGTFDRIRGTVITFGGLRQIYQSRAQDTVIPDTEDEAYVEAMPHLQFVDVTGTAPEDFPSASRDLLWHTAGRCGQADLNRVFGAGLVHDLRRDRYITFGGAYVTGEPISGVACARTYGVDTSLYTSQILSDSRAFKEWAPSEPTRSNDFRNVQIRSFFANGGTGLPEAPPGRIGHTMVYDEHRGITVVYGGWDGNLLNLDRIGRETWEYAPTPLEFLEHPAPLTEACLGSTLTLSVTPLARELPNFQWFHGALPIPDATNRSLVIPNINSTHEGRYSCQLSTPCDTRILSQEGVVRVGGPPVITSEPESTHVCPGDTAEARLFFTSDFTATVQWYRVDLDSSGNAALGASVPLADHTSNLLQFSSMKPAQNGYYRARVTNRCGSVWTGIIEMTAGVWLKAEPFHSTNEVCTSTQFAVLASGKGPLRYQWRRNGEPMPLSERITGTQQHSLTFNGLRYLDDAAYDCVISDACNSVTSRVSNITIIPNPPFLLSDTSGPPPRNRHGMVYDSVRGVTVLFGGLGDGNSVSAAYRNDTWEYDGTNWTQRFPQTSPGSRVDFGMTFDRHRGRVVLFGGATNNAFSGGFHNGETWEYDGTNWTQRTPASGPAPRHSPALFYDPVRRVTTLYGGDTTASNPRIGDLWTWNGSTWTRKETTGDRPLFGQFGSPARPQMVWDERRGYAVLPPAMPNDGTSSTRVTWTWDGSGWTAHPHLFEGLGRSAPQAGSGMGLVFDTFRGEVIYWGGSGFDQEALWRWNGTEWRKDPIDSYVGYHLDAGSSYDQRRNSVVFFGGLYAGNDLPSRGYSRRTFERVLADVPVVLRQPAVINNPATNTLFVRVVVAGTPPLSYEWQRDGEKLPERFPYAGVNTPALAVDRALAFDTGRYRCLIRGRCGEVLSFATTLTGALTPSGLVLSALSAPVAGQPGLALSWSGANVVLERAPAPNGPWVAVPGALSPYTPVLSGSSGFFRLRQL